MARCSGLPSRLDDVAFRIIHPPKNRFYADPFLFEKNGRHFLFFEDYSYSSRKGVISCLELNDEHGSDQPVTVLERRYHLSYPFVFECDGEIYMLPETGENNCVELYRAPEFPFR